MKKICQFHKTLIAVQSTNYFNTPSYIRLLYRVHEMVQYELQEFFELWLYLYHLFFFDPDFSRKLLPPYYSYSLPRSTFWKEVQWQKKKMFYFPSTDCYDRSHRTLDWWPFRCIILPGWPRAYVDEDHIMSWDYLDSSFLKKVMIIDSLSIPIFKALSMPTI